MGPPASESGVLLRLGLAAYAEHDLDRADVLFARAITLDPLNVAAFVNRGVVLRIQGRLTEALANYDSALALEPDHAKAHNNRGNTLRELERRDEALAAYDTAIACSADYAEAHSNRGNVLRDLGRLDDALTAYEAAIALTSQYVEAHANRGHVLHDLGRLDDALASYDVAIALSPAYGPAHVGRGYIHLLRGEFAQGWPDYEWRVEKFAALRGDDLLRLLRGQFAQGWTDYELLARKLALVQDHNEEPLRIGGRGVNDKTVLVYGEQGLGDTIQFCRYIRLLSEAGAKILFAPQQPLTSLMRPLARYCSIVDLDAPDLPDNVLCPLLSLPLVAGATLDTIPSDAPYLSAEPERVARWAERLGQDGFKVGVCWQGSTGNADVGRSFPLAALHRIAAAPGVRLINLHKGAGLSQLDLLPPGMRVERLEMDPDTGGVGHGFLDTAAVISLCDLVITVDTAVAHLAGALGAQAWVALRKIPDWRWMLDRADSPWYPTLRLFRQTVRGDWDPVFAQMESALRLLIQTRRSQS